MPKVAESTTGVKHEVRPERTIQQFGADEILCYCGYTVDKDQVEQVGQYPENTCNNCSSIRKGKREERYQ